MIQIITVESITYLWTGLSAKILPQMFRLTAELYTRKRHHIKVNYQKNNDLIDTLSNTCKCFWSNKRTLKDVNFLIRCSLIRPPVEQTPPIQCSF